MAREVNASSGYKSNRKLFSDEQEILIAKYLITAGGMYYGLSPKDARVLAYQCAYRFNVKFLHQWSANSVAGEDWLSVLFCEIVTLFANTISHNLGQSHKF